MLVTQHDSCTRDALTQDGRCLNRECTVGSEELASVKQDELEPANTTDGALATSEESSEPRTAFEAGWHESL